jgi:hypothetical protein
MALPVSPIVGHDANDLARFSDYVQRTVLDIAADFTSNVYRQAIPMGKTIVAVRLRVKTAATGGTAPTVAVADSAGVSFIGAADFDPSTAGLMKNSLMTAETGSGGKHYSTPSLLVVTLAGTAAPTAGELVLEVVYDGYAAHENHLINNYTE